MQLYRVRLYRNISVVRVKQIINNKSKDQHKYFYYSTTTLKMPSSKGEPTDPELREKIKEEVKAEEKGKI